MNGCDAGREGELIFAYIIDVAKSGKPVRRLWVSSMTQVGDPRGFEHLRPGEEMQQPRGCGPLALRGRLARRHERHPRRDGHGRALGGVVSLGRVQTPTLALIVRRELEIEAFEPETYFQVDAAFGLDGGRGLLSAAGSRARTTARRARKAEAVATAAAGATATGESASAPSAAPARRSCTT